MTNFNDNVRPSHKVGIKILSEEQLNNVFPNYLEAMARIDEHRSWLKAHPNIEFEHYQYNLMFDNVFSIFGQRGTGKTSVVFTLYNNIKKNEAKYHDIVLPIIIPELIPSEVSALGWLLALVKDQVIEFEEQIKGLKRKQESDQHDRFWENCKYDSSDGLIQEIDSLLNLFYSAKYNPSNEVSYNIAVQNSSKQSQHYYEFAKKIAHFWDMWIGEIKKNYGEVMPLIYFMFDDVDITPKKIDELLSIIIKYLSHPNIIVITTAEEEMLLEVIEERMDREIGRLPKEWRVYLRKNEENGMQVDSLNTLEDLMINAARRYLGKVMPASARYYLKRFRTAEEKHSFYIEENLTLYEGIKSQIEKLLEVFPDAEDFFSKDGVKRDYYLNFLVTHHVRLIIHILGSRRI